MKIGREDLNRAVTEGILERHQAESLFDFLRNRPHRVRASISPMWSITSAV